LAATISVVIVNFNGKHLLGALLESLSRQTKPADEVILVDNASTDGTVDYVSQHFPWVRLIQLQENVGFAEGNNVGLAQAGGDYIALLNSDTVVADDYLATMCNALDVDANAGAVVPKILRLRADPGEPPIIECTGAEFNSIGLCWGRGANERDLGQFDLPTEVPALTACATVLRRSALAGEPLFDRRLFMYYEEFELSLRVRGRGHTIVYEPTAIVHHKGAQSVKNRAHKPLLFTQFYANRNRVKLLAKYYPPSVLIRNFALIFLSLAYWNTYFLIHGGPILCLRALSAQLTYALQGISERVQGGSTDATSWLGWMIHERLSELLTRKSKLQGYVQ
jgi:GT2 family glycosyltransferase